MKKKSIAALALVLVCAFIIGCGGGKSVTSVSLNKAALTLEIGQDETLVVTVEPDGADKGVTWSVASESEQGVIEINQSGKVTAKKAGTATVKVVSTANTGKSATCAVTVNAAPAVTGIEIAAQPTKTAYNYGEIFNPAGMVVNKVYDNGTKEAVTDYTYKTTALTHADTTFKISYGTFEADVTLSVGAIVTGIVIGTPPVKLVYYVGDSFSAAGLIIAATYSNASTADFEYGVDDGFAFSPAGALTVADTSVVISFGGKTVSQPITVYAKTTQITVTGNNATIYSNDNSNNTMTFSIQKTANSKDDLEFERNAISGSAEGVNITYNSSSRVATVTAVSNCVVEITVKATDGSNVTGDKTITVTVATRARSVSLNKNSVLLLIDEEETLSASVYPGGATNTGVTWEIVEETDLDGQELSSGEVIALDNGIITAIGTGLATVKVITDDGGYEDTCAITVANLKLIGGTVLDETPLGDAIDDVTGFTAYIYSIAPGSELTLIADEVPAGNMFVGWDIGAPGYRLGNPGETEYTFEMTNVPHTIWAASSPYNDVFVTNGTTTPFSAGQTVNYLDGNAIGGSANLSASTATLFGRTGSNTNVLGIRDGKLSADGEADPDLEGFSGFGLGVPGTAVAGNHARLRGSMLSNVNSKGAVTITYIFKNRHPSLDVSFEITPESYYAVFFPGVITVPANSTVKKTVVIPHGIHNDFFLFVIREAVGGTASDRIELDIVARQAPTYMIYDPALPTEGVVKLGSYPTIGRTVADNDHGLTLHACNVAFRSASASVMNLESAITEPGQTTVRVYFRLVNYNSTSESYTFGFGTTNAATGSVGDVSLGSSGTIALGSAGEESGKLYFHVDINISDIDLDNETVYFSFTTRTSDANIRRSFSIQMSYADVYGADKEGL